MLSRSRGGVRAFYQDPPRDSHSNWFLAQDQWLRIYKEHGMHGGSGLRPGVQYLCTRPSKDDERIGCGTLSQVLRQQSGGCTFFFSKIGRANVYMMRLFDGASMDPTKVVGCKKALRREPHAIVCHPEKVSIAIDVGCRCAEPMCR